MHKCRTREYRTGSITTDTHTLSESLATRGSYNTQAPVPFAMHLKITQHIAHIQIMWLTMNNYLHVINTEFRWLVRFSIGGCGHLIC